MNIFAVSDLHLPGNLDKTMDMFGTSWQGHWDKIRADWKKRVTDEDIVLIAGDISWAMQLQYALPDLASIGELPGKKILIKGNHDYWWSSLAQVRAHLPQTMFVLQNDALKLGNYIFCGTRGWLEGEDKDNKKIFMRELGRLELTLSAAKRLQTNGEQIIALMHYPPVLPTGKPTEFCKILESYNVSQCVYGHLHGICECIKEPFLLNGVTYLLTSCDMIDFSLRRITEE